MANLVLAGLVFSRLDPMIVGFGNFLWKASEGFNKFVAYEFGDGLLVTLKGVCVSLDVLKIYRSQPIRSVGVNEEKSPFPLWVQNIHKQKHQLQHLVWDPSSHVRIFFLDKIHKLLKDHAIPSRYACAFALAASDCLRDVQTNATLIFILLYLNLYFRSQSISVC
ncbi:hypothetical protein AQUCO_02000044v1 [Aquilegia coerulea]|uniref:Uncharacterized protein n=1 Tax=Aquilegia coerulea TaxID=218851 RepID=A0A2G5DFN0_AQUCA|nr:hypothetical protein AQUCO_02000044v1 [Aquilegia coerulea]